MTEIQKYLKSGVEFTPAVVGFLVKDSKVCLGQRLKVSLGLGENIISGIGGKVGDNPEIKNESHNEALVREFKEEVAVTPINYKEFGEIRFIFPHQPKWNQTVRVYRISSWLGEPRETEVIRPIWFRVYQSIQLKYLVIF